MLKGIDKNYSNDEILTDLQTQLKEHGIVVVKVVRLIAKNGVTTTSQPCLIYFNSNTNINFVNRAIRYCCDHRIKWEHYRKPSRNMGTQCRNCQRMGHVAKNCGLPYRCCKCSQQHEPGQCSKQPTDKPVCVNCSKFHTSNWRGCDVIKQYLGNKNNPTITSISKPSNNAATAATSTNTSERQRLTYSDVIKHNQMASLGRPRNKTSNVSATQDQSNPFLFFETEVSNLFNLNFTELLRKMREFIPQYQSIQDVSQKQVLIMSFLFTVLK